MLNLKNIINSWDDLDFDNQLKATLESMGVNELPLQAGLSASSIALDNKIRAIVLDKSEFDDYLNIKTGLFYTGVIAGCNCADDPSPMDEQNEYCEINVSINKITGDSKISLLQD